MKWGIGTFVLGIFLSACGERDATVENPDDFWLQHRSEITEDFTKYFKEHNYRWIIHVHFNGNDFGALRDMQTAVSLVDSQPESSPREFPFTRKELEKRDAALSIINNYRDRSILLSLLYRHTSADRANRAFAELFECQDGHSELLEQTFVLGSGGSHGTDELDSFSERLKESCGKNVDLAILGDAIGQPGPFPKMRFKNLEEDGECIQFYQRNRGQILKGSAMENCFNVFVTSEKYGHVGLTSYSETVAERFLSQIEESVNQELAVSAAFEDLITK